MFVVIWSPAYFPPTHSSSSRNKNEVNLIVGVSKSESWRACKGLNQQLSPTAQTKKMLQILGAHSATLL